MTSSAGDKPLSKPVRLAYVVSHPIQYQVPLLRRIAADPRFDLTVFFGSDLSLRTYKDRYFGVEVKWDVPLLGGYRSEFLPKLRHTDTETEGIVGAANYGIFSRLRGRRGRQRFDAVWVHGYTNVLAIQAIFAARLLRLPVLIRSDSRIMQTSARGLRRTAKHTYFSLLGKVVSGALSSGTENAAYFRAFMGDRFPVFPMPYAVDNDWFQQQSTLAAHTREQLRAELGLAPGRPVILYASKLQTRKHCNHLIEAFLQLAPGSTYAAPYLVIVGDGEERANLERQAAASGSDAIRFTGFQNQTVLPRYFDLCDVFILPAIAEPWGLVVNEVMNASRPVIVSDQVGCHPDLISNGVEGFVYPAGDVPALAHALSRTLATPETARRMGQNAFSRIQPWSFDADLDALDDALHSILHRESAIPA